LDFGEPCGKPLDQWAQLMLRHVWDEIVEHTALSKQRMDASFGSSSTYWLRILVFLTRKKPREWHRFEKSNVGEVVCGEFALRGRNCAVDWANEI
jgi:hypothetical protein